MNVQDMNYPNQAWNPEDKELLGQHILMHETIKNLKWGKNTKNKIEDLTKCWMWEIARTQLYDFPEDFYAILKSKENVKNYKNQIKKLQGQQEKIDSINRLWITQQRTHYDWIVESIFPFCIDTFPKDAYLSHAKSTRLKWVYKDEPITESHGDLFCNNLFLPEEKQGWMHFLQTNFRKTVFSANADNVYVGKKGLTHSPYKQQSSSVPMIFSVGVNWDKTRLKKAIDGQWKDIQKERDKLIENYENLGANFEQITKVRIDEKLKPALIQLGAYRWLHHSKLSWEHIDKFRKKKFLPGDFPYSTQAKLRESVLEQKNSSYFPRFNFEKEGNNSFNYLLRTIYDS
ncbi:hypothetical protein N8920_07215 [Opitutales bacterium]|nr:hypothetical protein [Opitutales bacterium]